MPAKRSARRKIKDVLRLKFEVRLSQAAPRGQYAPPDYAPVHQELKPKGVTLQLLWEEYGVAHGEQAYRYSQFCAHHAGLGRVTRGGGNRRKPAKSHRKPRLGHRLAPSSKRGEGWRCKRLASRDSPSRG